MKQPGRASCPGHRWTRGGESGEASRYTFWKLERALFFVDDTLLKRMCGQASPLLKLLQLVGILLGALLNSGKSDRPSVLPISRATYCGVSVKAKSNGSSSSFVPYLMRQRPLGSPSEFPICSKGSSLEFMSVFKPAESFCRQSKHANPYTLVRLCAVSVRTA